MGIKDSIARGKAYAAAAILYLLVALLRFGNILLHIKDTVPGANGDTYQNLWGLWWPSYAVFNAHQNMFYTTLLYLPIGANLIYQTMSPISSLLSYPLQGFGIPFAYNIIFFLGFVVSALGMFVLSEYVVKNRYASFLAGLFFSFCVAHVSEAYAHLNWINIGWIPFCIYFFLRIADGDTRLANSMGLGICLVLVVFMGDIEQGIMTLLVLLLLLAIYAARKKSAITVRFAKALAISAIIAFVFGSWGFIPIIMSLGRAGTLSVVNEYNNLSHNFLQSYDVLSFFLPSFSGSPVPKTMFESYFSTVFSIDGGSPVERAGYIGYTLLALCFIAVYKNKKAVKMWVAIAIIFAILALGPLIHIYSMNTGVPGPFLILRALPVTNVILEPGRLGIIMLMALSIVGAYGFVELLKLLRLEGNAKRYKRYAAVAAISVLFLFETWGSPQTTGSITNTTTTVNVPNFYKIIRSSPYNFSIMQIPTLPSPNGAVNLYTGEDTYYTAISHKPILGGYLSRVNYTESEYLYYLPLSVMAQNLEGYGEPYYVSPINENYTNQTLLVLFQCKTLFVVLDKAAYSSEDDTYLASWLSGVFGQPVYSGNSITVFNTQNAIDSSVFRSFVSYYVLSQWVPEDVSYGGYTLAGWSPRGGGGIAVYAPYPKGAAPNSYQDSNYTVNATITFAALGLASNATLTIYEQAGTERTAEVASMQIAQQPGYYKVKLNGLVSGNLGNSLFFAASNSSAAAQRNNASDVLITNITIS